MSRVLRRACLPLLLGGALLLPASAAAEQRLITIQTPSRFVDPATQSFNGEDHPGRLQANVLLPDGYASHPRRRYPLLLLLHGAGDRWDSWTRPDRGNIRQTAKGLNAVIVMPEGARGFYADWWNGGKRRDPAWERHIREALIPQIERRFRIRRGRRWHTIAGLSMGGFGTLLTASQNPGYFGAAVPLSAFAEPQRPQVEPFFPYVTGSSYETIFGPSDGFYADAHNPVKLTPNLQHTRLDVFTGNGAQDPEKPPASNPLSGILEAELKLENDNLVSSLRAVGARVRYTVHLGTHDWPYWREDLRAAISHGLFKPVVARPGSWTFKTTSRVGRMWSLNFRFAEPPPRTATFKRNGHLLEGRGAGRVTISNGRGCRMTVRLPFKRQFPLQRCR